MALLGQFNSQEVMTAEIKAASEHGVDFFAVLWYYIDPQAKHIYAVSASDSQQEITLDLPACGFVRLESCTETSATQAATKRSAGGGWFRRRSGRGRPHAHCPDFQCHGER